MSGEPVDARLEDEAPTPLAGLLARLAEAESALNDFVGGVDSIVDAASGRTILLRPGQEGLIERLRNEGQRFRLLVENVKDHAIFVLDPAGRVASWNASAEHMTCYAADAILGAPHEVFFTPEDQQAAMPALALKTAREVGRYERECWRVRADGSRFLASEVVSALRTSGAGELYGFGVVTRDLTESRRAEQLRARLAEEESERKAAQAAATGLRRSEERFRQLANAMPQVVWSSGADGQPDYFNERWYEFTGARSETDGAGWLPFLHPEDHESALAAWQRSVTTGAPYEHEFRLRNQAGEYKWHLARGLPVRDEAGQVVRWYGTATDFESAKRTEGALRESQRFLEQAQEVGQIGSWTASVVGASGAYCWSPEVYRIFGVAPGTAVTEESFFALVHPDDREGMRRAVQASVKDGAPYTLEHRIIRPDGAVRWIAERARVVSSPDGRDVKLIGVCHDVTERVESELALKESVASLRAVFDGSLDAIVIADSAGRCMDVNKAACVLLGSAREDLLRRSVKELVPAADRGQAEERWSALLQVGEMRADLPMVRFDLTRREVEWAARADFIPGRHLLVLRDVTEKRRLEEQLRQAQKMDAVGRLAGGVAHDFNNLLTAINGYSELVLDQLGRSDPLRASITQIAKAGERATVLTRQLLAFSRKQLMQTKVLNINTIVRDVDSMLRRLVGESVEISTQLGRDLGQVKVDPGQLEQVIVNLVVNARDAMPDGGHLTIETMNDEVDERHAREHPDVLPGRYVALVISDSGTGMCKETLSRLFEPFFTTKPVDKGTGLGLCTVFGIVKQSGGSVSVYSEVGQGSSFRVLLPRVDQAVDPTGTRSLPALPPPKGTETILLVEDDSMVRTLAVTALGMSGYKVLEASNGGEGLLLCEQYTDRIDLLITDVVMPKMGGQQLWERLSKLRPGLKVLFMSGYTQGAILHQGVLKDDLAFVQKPFTPASLARHVRSVLDSPPAG